MRKGNAFQVSLAGENYIFYVEDTLVQYCRRLKIKVKLA